MKKIFLLWLILILIVCNIVHANEYIFYSDFENGINGQPIRNTTAGINFSQVTGYVYSNTRAVSGSLSAYGANNGNYMKVNSSLKFNLGVFSCEAYVYETNSASSFFWATGTVNDFLYIIPLSATWKYLGGGYNIITPETTGEWWILAFTFNDSYPIGYKYSYYANQLDGGGGNNVTNVAGVANINYMVSVLFQTYTGNTAYYDNIGCWNGSMADKPVTVSLSDITPPNITTNLSNNSVYNTNIDFYVSITENGDCNINNSDWNKNVINSSYFIFNDNNAVSNNYNINISCNDSSNNKAYLVYNFTKTTPIINLIIPSNDTLYRDNPLVYTFNFQNFNPINCSVYQNITNNNYTQIYSIKAGINNITSCYNETSYSNVINANDTLGAFQFENNLNDISPFGINGNGIGSYSYATSKNGNQTGNYSLNLSGGYIHFGQNYSFERTQPFSIAMWINPDSTAGYPSLFGKRLSSGTYRGYLWFIDSGVGGKMAVQINNDASSNNINVRSSTTNILTGVWQFVVFTYDGSSTASGVKLYYNGNPETITPLSNTLSATILNSINSEIGATDGNNLLFDGNIDNAVIYNKTLSQSEITILYNNWLLINTSNVTTICNSTLLNLTLNQSINLTFNYTYSDNTVKDFKYFANCYNGANINSSIYNFYYDNDFTAPIITVSSINQSYNETYNIDVWINFSVNEPAVCSINNTEWILFYSDGINFSYSDNGADNQFYTIDINCSDNSGNSAIKQIYFTKDKEYPYILFISPSIDNSTILGNVSQYKIKANLTDNNMLYYFYYNISYYEAFLDETTLLFEDSLNLTGKTYQYQKVINISLFPQNTILLLSADLYDAHTEAEIPEIESRLTDDSISFEIAENDFVEIKGLNAIDVSIEKQKDRYSFEFAYPAVDIGDGKIEPIPDGQIIPLPIEEIKEYEIITSEKIIYLPNSEYKGHFIIWKGEEPYMWLDFENENNILVEKNEEGNYIIKSYNADTSEQFNSIGFLNKQHRDVTFIISPQSKSDVFGFGFNPNNATSVLLLFAFLLFYIGLMFLGFHFNNVAFIGFGFFIGVIIGLLLAVIHMSFFIAFTLINLSILWGYSKQLK